MPVNLMVDKMNICKTNQKILQNKSGNGHLEYEIEIFILKNKYSTL